MCYDDNARPPEPPGKTGTASGQEIILKAADGTRFEAFYAQPAQHSHTGILIYPDVRGLHQFYKELALRFAEMGVNALAIDYFGRTAGNSWGREVKLLQQKIKELESAGGLDTE